MVTGKSVKGKCHIKRALTMSNPRSHLSYYEKHRLGWENSIGFNLCEEELHSLNVAISTTAYSTDCRDLWLDTERGDLNMR